ncbi:MAG: monoamine oxidase, partial [Variibacter sp.]|nr:monoamine oxidase [Variibacter sp.]
MSVLDVVVIGAGAAGIAAARRLHELRIPFQLIEARPRLGGRAWTEHTASGLPIDLGCGWLHSADENDWARIAERTGAAIDKTPPPWQREQDQTNFPAAQQREFRAALARFYERLEAAAENGKDRPAAEFLEPGDRWSALTNAISTYANGVELAELSVRDYARYHDTEVNWRVASGYGALIADHAQGLPFAFDCAATRIDHSGVRLRIETSRGAIEARAAIVTVPTPIIADETLRFTPPLPAKIEAAANLSLGLADKVFLHVERAELLPHEGRVFGATDRTETASYHLRPFGRPLVEGYFGGAHARALEEEGEGALAQFAIDELVAVLGTEWRARLTP